ncbi:MAG: PrsW family intramembrane metalloprotease [Candidatus Sungbacteria bacterium]|nr:PrsW family intramembrane metalloprotease [Candidatus Sungbacteria bacterium]
MNLDFAALVSAGSGYAALAFAPPIIWLLIYLREDKHREPPYLLILTFIGGTASALAALFIQQFLLAGLDRTRDFVVIFASIALIEEYVKYLVVKLLVLRRADFNEPVDAMIYMVTAGMGFAAMENLLFLWIQTYNPSLLIGANLVAGAQLSAARFIGANLLHALSSAVVGYFLAKAWFHPQRKHFVALGILLASILHASFNYLIILRDKLPGSLAYLMALLFIGLIVVLIDFHKLQKESA